MSHLLRTPPRPLSESVSQPDLFRTPETSDTEIHVRKRKCLNSDGHFTESSAGNASLTMQQMFNNVQQMFLDLKSSQDEQFSQIKRDISSLKQQNEDLLSSNQEIKKSVARISQEQTELKSRIEKLEEKDTVSDDYVQGLEQQVENMERKLRETSVEINNLPTESNEQLLTTIAQIHKTFAVEFDPRDLRSAFRLPAKSNSPRPIIIEYSSLQKKIELLQAYKKFKMANGGESHWTGVSGDKRSIFINELLTKKGKHLHYLARSLIKNSEWKFCWTSRGKIFIRKEEGLPAVEVRSDEQIASLYNKTNPMD